MKQLLREFAGYALASGAALCVDVVVLWILVQFCAVNFLVAATASFLFGALVAYRLSIRIAFRQHRLSNRRIELLVFLVIGSGGLCINAGIIYLGVQYLSLHYLFAKSVAAGFTFTFNFLARRHMLFVARPGRQAAA